MIALPWWFAQTLTRPFAATRSSGAVTPRDALSSTRSRASDAGVRRKAVAAAAGSRSPPPIVQEILVKGAC
jgi:hypothetical protein